MNRRFFLRLALDATAAGLLLVALAYYWLDNLVHELVGTFLFLLLVLHTVFNRHWYGGIARRWREAAGRLDVVLTLSLLAAMLALLVTSVIVSRTVVAFLGLDSGFTARQAHILAAYWVLVIVAIHLGLRWTTIMIAARQVFRIAGNNAARTTVLRIVAAIIAVQGVRSSLEMGIGSKLALIPIMDLWDFKESTLGFFLHYLSIVGLYIFLAHYTVTWAQSRKRRQAR